MDWVVYICSGLLGSLVFFLPAVVYNCLTYSIYFYLQRRVLIPVDSELSFYGERLIGDGRGIDGIFIALVAGSGTGWLFGNVEAGIYLAVGANCGCLLSSFIKRRLRISQSKNFFPLDDMDLVLGASALYATRYPLNLGTFLFGLFGVTLLHYLVSRFLRPIWE